MNMGKQLKRAVLFIIPLTLFLGFAAIGRGVVVDPKLPPALVKPPARPISVEGEVLVKFKPAMSAQAQAATWQALGATKRNDLPRGWARLRLAPGMSTAQAVAALAHDPAIEHAQPNYYYYAAKFPNDPNYEQLWGLKNIGQTIDNPSYDKHNPGAAGFDMDAELAWDHRTDCSAVVVAVLDAGINYTHQDLAGNMWDGGGAFLNHGRDFVDDDDDPFPTAGSESHGTHVAGTIGAVGNNGLGTSGVCWQVQIMSVRVLGASGTGTTAGIIQGIEFAADNGAHVINMSLGGGGDFDFLFSDSISYARDRDVVVVVAAGNETNNNDGGTSANLRWPCNFTQDNLICVAALDQAYALADFSNWGSMSVDVGAPGTNVMSSYPGPFIADDFSSGWTFQTLSGSGWDNVSCDFGLGPIPMMVNPSNWCSFGTYSNNTKAQVWKAFNLALGGVSAASASYLAFIDMNPVDPSDVFINAVSRAGGNPLLDSNNWTSVLTGSTQGSAAPFEIDLLERGCLTSTCSVGFEVLSQNVSSDFGVGILLFQIGTIQGSSNAYHTIHGTSMASPHAAGLAALVRAFNPDYTYADTVNAIKNGGDLAPALAGKTTTGRAINAMGSLAYINPPQGVRAVVQSQ